MSTSDAQNARPTAATVRAIGYQTPGPIAQAQSLVDIELPAPVAQARDVVVEVKALAVNPVDCKVRKAVAPSDGAYKVLGWDAAGVVVSVGREVSRFKPGDAVYYAGSIARQGCNMALHAVDERIVGHKPKSLDWAQAAALPLTALTAWETLFDRLALKRPVTGGGAAAILIIGGAGGVGSIAVQLARQLTHCQVIATASRPHTQAWVRAMGAHHVIDHTRGLAAQVKALGLGDPAFVFSTTHTADHWPELCELIAPQGQVALIDDGVSVDFMALKRKSVSIHHEFMFTRSVFETPDMSEQGHILDQVSTLVDQGTLRTTLSERLSPINAQNLRKAHTAIESEKTQGKIVLEGGFAP